MVRLKTDFAEGDVVWALNAASTSGLNGITATVNSNIVTKLAYITSDLTQGSHTGSTAETTIGNVTIPADVISTGITVLTTNRANVDIGHELIIRLKIGAWGSEATKETIAVNNAGAGPDQKIGANINYYETGQTWTNSTSVIVTTENDNVSGTLVGYCENIIVIGA